MSKLLIEEEPLIILPALATVIGLEEALVLQQLHYWLNKSRNEHDGRKWVYNTYEEWQSQLPFMTIRTLQRVMANLVNKLELVAIHRFNSSNWDRTNWYSIKYENLEKLEEDIHRVRLKAEEQKDAIATKRRGRYRQIGNIGND